MNRKGWTIAGFGVALSCAVLAVPILMFMVVFGANNALQEVCQPGSPNVVLAADADDTALNSDQLENAATIIAVGNRLGIPRQGIVIALAVASQESGFLNYANDGEGGDLMVNQLGIEASLDLPHQAVGTDHGSLGVFQQQWPWWGTMEELMDPATSSSKFYEALRRVPGWRDMPLTAAAQAVQISAYPEAYADDEPLARRLLSDPDLAAADITPASFGGTTECTPGTTFPGEVVFPLPAGSGYVDRVNWGNSGSHWSSTHTGTDFSVACGTPVLAATNGTVIVRRDQPWSGPWLVQVSTGVGQLTTWYAHMQELTVSDGEVVEAGQQIGEVGSMGNSTGCHLHFEVHRKGGSIYEDGVDPSLWLQRNVGRASPQFVPASSSTSGTVTIVTANIRYSVSAFAARSAVRSILAKGPDVVLLQEVAGRHLRGMVAGTPGNWTVHQPPGARGESAIIWDREKFQAVRKGSAFGASLRGGRWLTWALLESSSGELPVVSLHLPSRAHVDASQRADYLTMTRAYRELVADFVRVDYAPVLGGDWNQSLDRALRSWGPVSTLRSMGMTTNWRAAGPPCTGGTSAGGAHIDGFAFHSQAFSVTDHGCLPRGPSDHRPVWVRLEAQ